MNFVNKNTRTPPKGTVNDSNVRSRLGDIGILHKLMGSRVNDNETAVESMNFIQPLTATEKIALLTKFPELEEE